MKANTGDAVDKASAALHSVIDDAARKVKAPLDRMAEIAQETSDKALHARSQATDWLSKRGEQLAAPSQRLLDDTSAYVSANPLKSLGIAVLAALLVGRFMR
jgi:ElaB/YqjD/DUF883 family membrane-anchored ribosome-binding protein